MYRKLVVVGAGNIGLITASHLAKGKNEVALLEANTERAQKIREGGVRIVGNNDKGEVDFHLTPEDDNFFKGVYSNIEDLKDFDPEAVFISTKASALGSVTDSLRMLGRDFLNKTVFISAQNGLDTETYLADDLMTGNVLRMVINYIGNQIEDDPLTIRMGWLKGANPIGPLYKRKGESTFISTAREKMEDYARYTIGHMLTNSGLETEYSPDVKKDVWKKVILNATLCPICALTYTTMGEAMSHSSLRDYTEKVLIEGFNVAEKDGYVFGINAVEEFMGYLEKGGNHMPSMELDVLGGRKSEIDWLNGKIVEYGERSGVPVEYNNALTLLVRGIDELKRPCLKR